MPKKLNLFTCKSLFNCNIWYICHKHIYFLSCKCSFKLYILSLFQVGLFLWLQQFFILFYSSLSLKFNAIIWTWYTLLSIIWTCYNIWVCISIPTKCNMFMLTRQHLSMFLVWVCYNMNMLHFVWDKYIFFIITFSNVYTELKFEANILFNKLFTLHKGTENSIMKPTH